MKALSSAPTIGQVWRALSSRFAAQDIASAALDARLLVRHVLGIDETQLIAREREPFPTEAAARLETLASRRLAGEPVARIIGEKEFYGLSFGLNAATLIPRPETEMLVDFGLDHLRDRARPRILDLGTGTGCIVISLLVHLPHAVGVGVDIAPEALERARANAGRLGVSDRLDTLLGSWFGPIGDGLFDLIVSNPPYIARAVIETLDTGVKAHDPMAALDGGADGLDAYRAIAEGAKNRLARGGVLALEIGFDQGHMVGALLGAAGFSTMDIARDLAGHDRMIVARAHK